MTSSAAGLSARVNTTQGVVVWRAGGTGEVDDLSTHKFACLHCRCGPSVRSETLFEGSFVLV